MLLRPPLELSINKASIKILFILKIVARVPTIVTVTVTLERRSNPPEFPAVQTQEAEVMTSRQNHLICLINSRESFVFRDILPAAPIWLNWSKYHILFISTLGRGNSRNREKHHRTPSPPASKPKPSLRLHNIPGHRQSLPTKHMCQYLILNLLS